MNENWFLWNGVDSRTMGVVVDHYPALVRPDERVETVTVPGRQGDLTFMESSENMFNAYTVTVTCFLNKNADPGAVAKWLTGSGVVVFGSKPDRRQDARIVNQISYDLLLKARRHSSFAVPFRVQPLKGVYPEEAALSYTTENGSASVYNPADFDASPVYTATASEGQTELTLTVGDTDNGGSKLTVKLPTGTTGFILDLDTQTVTNLDGTLFLGSYSTVSENGMDGLKLLKDKYTDITWNNISSLTVKPQWRYLL